MRLFISYARIDSQHATELVGILRVGGHQPWFDEAILPGQDWKAILLKEIKSCEAFIYILTPQSIASQWCQWEFNQALTHSKPIVPVLIREAQLPPAIQRLHYANFTQGANNKAVSQLMGGLAKIAEENLQRAMSIAPQDAPGYFSNPAGIPAQVAWTDKRYTSSQRYMRDFSQLPLAQPTRLAVSKPENHAGGIIGIDFGTSNSLVAVIENGIPVIINNRYGRQKTPSAVGIDLSGKVIVGEAALQFALEHPERCVIEVKRLLGTNLVLEVDGQAYTPKLLASFVIEQLKLDAEEYRGGTNSGAVLTAPAYYTRNQIKEIKDAAYLAGLNVYRIIAEPTAASLVLGSSEDSELVLVYDLGGGTFDVSILEIVDGFYDVKAINGDINLGGVDFDTRIIDYCIHQFRNKTNIDLMHNHVARMRIRDAAERAKIVLSTTQHAVLKVPYIYGDSRGTYDMEVELSLDQYESLTGDLVDKTIECCEQALQDAKLSTSEVNKLICVGLSTRTPLVQKRLFDLLGKKPDRKVDPDTIVAAGAAIQGGILRGDVRDTLMVNVTSRTLSIETVGGTKAPMIKRNTTIPISMSETFTTSRDHQTKAKIHVLEGEIAMEEDLATVGQFILEDIPPAPKGEVSIKITIDIDANYALRVIAFCKESGIERVVLMSYTEMIFEPISHEFDIDVFDSEDDDENNVLEVESSNEIENNNPPTTLPEFD